MSLEGLIKLNRRLDAIGDTRSVLRSVQLRGVAEAKRLTIPIRKTGALGLGIVPGAITATSALVVATAAHSAFVERGTGIYGPKKKKITPKRAGVLAWRTGATRLSGRSRTRSGTDLAGWAFAKSVKGRKATPFLRPGVEKAIKSSALKADIVELWNKAA